MASEHECRNALLKRLGLPVQGPTASGEDGDAVVAWRDELREIELLFSQLRELGHIEERGHKYLNNC